MLCNILYYKVAESEFKEVKDRLPEYEAAWLKQQEPTQTLKTIQTTNTQYIPYIYIYIYLYIERERERYKRVRGRLVLPRVLPGPAAQGAAGPAAQGAEGSPMGWEPPTPTQEI